MQDGAHFDALHLHQLEAAPRAAASAEAKAKLLGTVPADPAVPALLKKASKAARPGKRIRLILEAASTWAAPAMAMAACRRGCSHCWPSRGLAGNRYKNSHSCAI